MESQELMTVSRPQDLYVSPVVGMDEAKAKFEQVRKFTADCLTKDVDYGSFAGVSKPSLLKPGAEKVATLFGLTPRFECVDKTLNWNGEGNPENEPFFYFEYRCKLYKDERFIASCDASCNSWEKKYRYRKGGLKCPNCGKQTLMVSKYNKDEYYCNSKSGGCGGKFLKTDTRIANQSVGETKNFDTAEQVNTFQKMAQKRAFIGAVLIACNLSEYYTQDTEDMDGSAFQVEVPEVMDGEFTQVQPQQPQPQPQKPKFDEVAFLRDWNEKVTVLVGSSQITLPMISLEGACDIDTKNSDGTVKKMGERGVGELAGMWKAYKQRLSDPGVNKDDVLMRLSAVNRILTEKAKAQAKLDAGGVA